MMTRWVSLVGVRKALSAGHEPSPQVRREENPNKQEKTVFLRVLNATLTRITPSQWPAKTHLL